MKVSREQAAQNRERIVDTAAQLFRERGFEGHFSSKEDLIAEASARALMRSLALFSKVAERGAADPLSAIATAYLTSRHRDKPGEGWFRANRKPHEDRRPSARTQHWWAPWSWRAPSMIVRCRRISWMLAWRLSKPDSTMKAFILDRYGSADRVRAGDMPDPELREDDSSSRSTPPGRQRSA